MGHTDPDLDSLRGAVAEFDRSETPERSWTELLSATGGRLDLGVAEHRTALHGWLNAWGCRIRYPRDGEPDVFDTGLLGWWEQWRSRLPGTRVALADLTERHFAGLGDCYTALAATVVSGPQRARTLGATAAAKALYALRPQALMPWDQAIAERLHGGRDGAAYVAHQRLGQRWARRVLAEAGVSETALCAELGRPGRSLAKVLDEYCYLTYTRGPRRVTVEDVRRIASVLPRTEEHLIRDRVKFRIGRIVYLALSRDEQTMGFAFPKEERDGLVASEPGKFSLPSTADLRYNWVHVDLAEIDETELAELIVDAWRMCVPKRVAAEYAATGGGLASAGRAARRR